tara:strand:- start:8218 stop:8985 length:768 start_codon:yes stop_codon:yes gene_type:complete
MYDAPGTFLQTWPMIQYKQKIYKGVTNTLQMLVRNVDRRPVDIAGLTLTAQMINVETQQTVLVKPVSITNAQQGQALVNIEETDTQFLPVGFYSIQLTSTNSSNVQRFLYSDQYQGTEVAVELLAGTQRELVPATELTQFTPTPLNWWTDILYVTSSLPGTAQTGETSGTHTWVVYTTNWLGKLWMQGSLTENVPTDHEWFMIPLTADTEYKEWTGTSNPGIWQSSITQNLYWVRFIYQSAFSNIGTFDKILYKS